MKELIEAVLSQLKETKNLAEEAKQQRMVIIREMKEMNKQLDQLNKQLMENR